MDRLWEQEKAWKRSKARQARRMAKLQAISYDRVQFVQRVSPILRDLERDGHITITPIVFAKEGAGRFKVRFLTHTPSWLRRKTTPKPTKRALGL
jgi:hypothetical protein